MEDKTQPKPEKNGSKEGYNPIPKSDGKSNILELVGQHSKDIANQGKLLNWTFAFMVGITVVCVLGFLGFLIAYFQYNAQAYYQYTDTLNKLRDNYKLNERVIILEKSLIPTPISTVSQQKD
ncbi:MAG: hypothetical protein V1922_00105 [bacterium]